MENTAAGLWDQWVRAGALRPQDYDADVENHVRNALEFVGVSSASSLVAALNEAGWTSRDLVRALAPVVASFAGMLRDLLRLMTRVGASSGTGENLRLVYEFDEHDTIDESLSAFRETVERVESAVVRIRPLVFNPDHVWKSPIRRFDSLDDLTVSSAVGEALGRNRWRFADGVPKPHWTGDPRIDVLSVRALEVVRQVVDRLAEHGDDANEVRDRLGGPDRALDPTLEAMAHAALDLWPYTTAAQVNCFAIAAASGAVSNVGPLLAEFSSWLDGFEGDAQEVIQEQTVRELADVLSLPSWGKRHELYSAWIATQLDRALGSGRLDFVVENGVLRFPFRPTLLARLDPPLGDIELWCEVRTAAEKVTGPGRKRAIQPDYRFLRRSDQTTVAAVEAKQYLRSATRGPGAALCDYVMNLPEATVLLVAHGPMGKKVLDAVPSAERHRARVHRHVRAGRAREAAAFREDVAAMLPTRPRRPDRIELRWSDSVHDLDLHISAGDDVASWQNPVTPHAALRSDERDGGPEIVDLHSISTALDVRVHVYSDDTLQSAAPVVAFVWNDGNRVEFMPSEDFLNSGERFWRVGSIGEGGNVTPSADSRIEAA